jgi:hypothetical protein
MVASHLAIIAGGMQPGRNSITTNRHPQKLGVEPHLSKNIGSTPNFPNFPNFNFFLIFLVATRLYRGTS